MSVQSVSRTVLSVLFVGGVLAFFLLADASASGKSVEAEQKPVPEMIPHKALYEIRMISKNSSAQLLNISGQMYYETQKTCDSWITDHRFKLLYEYADSPPVHMSSDFSTVESLDGQRFDFSTRRKREESLYEEFRGSAKIPEKGEALATYSVPQDLRFDLTGAYFPTAHTRILLEKARQGKTFFSAKVFDGSDGEGPAEINAFIGKKVNAVAEVKANTDIDMTLLNTPAWKIRMAFFPLEEPNTAAEYEMELYFHENGIVSDMIVDYEDFSVSQKLLALEKLEPDECGNALTE